MDNRLFSYSAFQTYDLFPPQKILSFPADWPAIALNNKIPTPTHQNSLTYSCESINTDITSCLAWVLLSSFCGIHDYITECGRNHLPVSGAWSHFVSFIRIALSTWSAAHLGFISQHTFRNYYELGWFGNQLCIGIGSLQEVDWPTSENLESTKQPDWNSRWL